MSPLISVIMSVYNDVNNLTYSINSVLNQDFKDFEFLIMNDGSTDETSEILNTYSEDNRIKMFENKKNLIRIKTAIEYCIIFAILYYIFA